jgi:hypothetical protein
MDEDDDVDPADVERMDRLLQHQEARSQPPYDGVMGTPPAWVPEGFRIGFVNARNALLDNFRLPNGEHLTPEIIRSWVEAYRTRGDEHEITPLWLDASYDRGVRPHVGTLANILAASLLGEREGLKILLGEDAVALSDGRQRQQKRREGGKNSAASQRLERKELRTAIREKWEASTLDERSRAASLAERFHVSPTTVRRYCEDLRTKASKRLPCDRFE